MRKLLLALAVAMALGAWFLLRQAGPEEPAVGPARSNVSDGVALGSAPDGAGTREELRGPSAAMEAAAEPRSEVAPAEGDKEALRAAEPAYFVFGTVVDESARPVPRATVRLLPSVHLRGDEAGRGTTDELGKFRIEVAAVSLVDVLAEHGERRGRVNAVLPGEDSEVRINALPCLELFVRDASGAIVPGVVTLESARSWRDREERVLEAGAARFPGLALGLYTARIHAGEREELFASVPIAITREEIVSKDVVLPAPVPIAFLVRDSQSRAALADVPVELKLVGTERVYTFASSERPTELTLSPGRYSAEYRRPGYVDGDVLVTVEPTDRGGDPEVLWMDPAERVSGFVTDADGAPLAGVAVRRIDASARTTTDAAGAFTLDGLWSFDPEGNDVAFEHEGFQPAVLENVEVPRPEPLQVVLQRWNRLRGTVRADAEPVPFARLSVTWLDSTLASWISPRPHVHEADANGRFDLSVGAGRILVSAEGAGFPANFQIVEFPSVGGGSELRRDFDLRSWTELTGSFRMPDGRPVAGARVGAIQGEASSFTRVAEDGTFELAIRPGAYELQLFFLGEGASAMETVTLPRTEPLDVVYRGRSKFVVLTDPGLPIQELRLFYVQRLGPTRFSETRRIPYHGQGFDLFLEGDLLELRASAPGRREVVLAGRELEDDVLVLPPLESVGP